MKLPRLMLMLLTVTRKHPLLVCTSACFPTQLFNSMHEFIANITHVIVGSLLVCLFYMCKGINISYQYAICNGVVSTFPHLVFLAHITSSVELLLVQRQYLA
jgi:hypothetical protein